MLRQLRRTNVGSSPRTLHGLLEAVTQLGKGTPREARVELGELRDLLQQLRRLRRRLVEVLHKDLQLVQLFLLVGW